MSNYSHIWLICLLLLPLMGYGDIEPTIPGCEQGGLQGSPYICLPTENQPHRTAYHFQPAKNWMNDPNGPMIYQGIYHFFYQYNSDGAVWGNISWGHSTSTDLVNWTPQPIAIWPSQPSDINGCWSGSATILPGEVPALLYTGGNSKNEQVQNLALPKDLSDPYLIEWVKSQHNPLMIPSNENQIGVEVFRDPSTAWLGNDAHWRVAIGIERNRKGVTIIYKSKDFIHWTMDVEHQLHSTQDTGMWECVDFFPVATNSLEGLDTSTTGYGTKHVLKSSMVDVQSDFYTIGIYDTDRDIFMPDMDFSPDHSGLRLDYGNFYASKTFFDSSTNRRILWGWVKEKTDEATNIMKGWSGLQAIPRSIWLDESGKQLVQWPIAEIEKLRMNEVNLHNELLEGDSVLEVHGITCSQADVDVSFAVANFENAEILYPSWTDPQMICSQKGASVKGGIGPFGLRLLASENMEEYTAVYFTIFKNETRYVVLMCTDLSKSSSSSLDYEKPTYGAFLDINPVNEELTLRSLIDHSIVESFGGHGKTSMIARVYPSLAVDSEAHLYAFNNGKESVKISTLSAWSMKTAQIG